MNAASRDFVLKGSGFDLAALVAGPLLIVAMMLFMGGWAGPGANGASAGFDAFIVILAALPWAFLWLAAAAGLGWPLRVWLARDNEHSIPIQLGLGIATLLTIDAALGRLGLLHLGGGVGAWAVILIGIALLGRALWQGHRAAANSGDEHAAPIFIAAPPWLMWTAGPAIAVLLLASTSAPGWLWASEFGGYDVMSYHLQLPKEWVALGAIQPLEHNVYSFLPGYMEGAYYHLMLLHGDPIGAVYATQVLHAAMALLTAWLVWRFVAAQVRDESRQAASIAPVVLIGTPWVIVVGSLAYNELATALMLAAGLLVYQCRAITPAKRGALMGVLAAAACGAKLTAVGFVAVPLGVALLMSSPARQWPRAIAAGTLAGVIVLSPYLVGNAVASGNPVFPFATSVFGAGHWDEQQVQTWNDGHMAAISPSERLTEAWRQLMRYGIGANPYEGEPWHAQWSILPWLALAAVAVTWLLRRRDVPDAVQRRSLVPLLVLILVIQLLFWIGFTHVKSRFMVPAVVPAAIVIGMAWLALSARINTNRRPMEIALGIALLIWSSVPAVIFARQAGGTPAARIGMAELLTGEGMSEAEQRQLGAVHPAIHINHVLPDNSRVLLVGEAAPLYYLGDYAYQTTWDRGPLSQAMRRHGDDASAWLADLRQRGYTHLLINAPMLERWEQSGWNDPLITSRRVLEFAERHGELQQAWPSGEQLFHLR